MKKYRLKRDGNKYRVQRKDWFSLYSWINIEYFYGEEEAKRYYDSVVVNDNQVLIESKWV